MTASHQGRIRIAILVRQFPSIVQTYVLTHIIGLKEAGLKTIIIAKRDPKQDTVHPAVYDYQLLDETLYIDTEADSLIRQLFRLPVLKPRYWELVARIIFSGIWKKQGVKYALKAMISIKARAEHEFDIIHSHSLFTSYDYLYLKEVFGIPITTTFHGLVPGNVRMLDSRKIRSVLESVDAVFVNTRFASRQLEGYGCSENRIHVIPQGTNLADFPYNPRKIADDSTVIILSVGRLSPEKGFDIAIRAIAEYKKLFDNIPIEYRIIGDGIEKDRLNRLSEKLGLKETVYICGSLSTEELRANYLEAHLLILPSIDPGDGTHTETQGVVLQEAQASGAVVIASRTGGIPEVIRDRMTGLLFNEGDVTGLADHIHTLINDSSLYESLCKNGRRDVEENFAAEVIRDRLISVYKRLLEST